MLLKINLFWKSVRPPSSEKSSTHNKITLAEPDLILNKSENVAEIPNNSFINVISNLNIQNIMTSQYGSKYRSY